MKKTTCIVLGLAFFCQMAQGQKSASEYKSKLGLKAGYNWSYLTGNAEGFKKDNKSGFMVGAFYAPVSQGRGFRTEIVFSRQGYSFDNGGQNTDVLNDYIYLPQLATYTIGKFLQLQAGAQIGILLNSKLSKGSKDSTITDLMNRVDYGFAGGVEIYPVKGLLIGGRYNLGLGKLYKRYEEQINNPIPRPFPLPFDPAKTDFRNGVVQFYIGYRF
jgi:hypothetical protein